MTVQDDPRPVECRECRECQAIDLVEAVARGEGDASRETDCRVLRRRHRAAAHGTQP
ncbi:hypothetical protein OG782_22190 [Streptomyces sp. NBC_00876]|uniref:hypothetical protein n=1 Tax=Streptomyces sp. NBC_00876 TaxID=2975853 RepID=UPI003863AEDC|nr:hypothetical protein OG782_22190 [Streptomyces sp. NBC_00876]